MRSIPTKVLVRVSYSDHGFDSTTVLAIAEKLSRSELKQYVTALKREEQKRTIVVESAQSVSDTMKETIKKIFSGKKVVFNQDTKLILGMRITDNDLVYNSNLKNTFDKAIEQIQESYE